MTFNVLEAETLRLNSGETLKGRIRVRDEKTLYLESTLTSQQLKVDRADIRLIEFESTERSMTRRLGIGLYYRPNSTAEEISLKNWISSTDAIELQLGYKDGIKNLFSVEARVRTTAQTGVEMEALLSVTVVALTIYDMCKSIDKSIEISKIRLLSKKGGKSGNYKR